MNQAAVIKAPCFIPAPPQTNTSSIQRESGGKFGYESRRRWTDQQSTERRTGGGEGQQTPTNTNKGVKFEKSREPLEALINRLLYHSCGAGLSQVAAPQV
ncbi:hypothetical protein ATANTOWER_006475 [Ataeniobius toweri]|uniref:Uncharacterized protein n=1 Tax=Ataeniobius toweri TaxID=208326 RepID=A0ABU7ADL8_9TELE|nr:hypothetical protein [Ataeniobius toweri]